MVYNINVEFQITSNKTDKQTNNQTKWSRQEIRISKTRAKD